MKLNVMFTIAAVYGIVFGLTLLLAPAALAPISGLPTSAQVLFSLRTNGVTLLGLGLIAWFVRNADASKARDAVTLGFTIFFALFALLSLVNQFMAAAQPAGWGAFVIQGLIAVGFFMAGKASMSTSAS